MATATYTIEVVLKKNGALVDKRISVEWVAFDSPGALHVAFDNLLSAAKLVKGRYTFTDPGESS